MKEYEIFDINKGIGINERIQAFGKSPMDALKSIGYTDIARDYTGKYGNIIVFSRSGKGGSYVYYGRKQAK